MLPQAKRRSRNTQHTYCPMIKLGMDPLRTNEAKKSERRAKPK